jgi:hypothetical protein
MQKKRLFYQIKYFNYSKFEIKLKKVTFVFISFSTFARLLENIRVTINK